MWLLLALELIVVETRIDKERCFVHEPVTVSLVLRFDAEEVRSRAVQLFAQELDVPVRVEAPWLAGIDGAAMRPPAPATGPTLAVNDEIVPAVAVPGGLEIRRVFVPDAAGELSIPPARIRYATATRFREDFVHGRVAVDRKDFVASSTACVVPVRPLPAEGRPERFGGAVGRFVVRAETGTREVRPMESFPVILTIEGEGNLDAFPPPRLEAPGFHVFGRADAGGDPRRITYDIAAVDATVREIPPLALWYFDPAEAAYRAARTEAIPLRVIGPPPSEEPRTFPWWTVPVGLALAALVALRLRRRREPDAIDRAAAAFRQDGDFPAFLARVLGCPPAAVISPDLATRLEARGLAPDLAGRAAALVESLVAARYGGASDDAVSGEAEALVAAISASRRAAPGSRSGR